ncbi:hypothetical protein RhiirB3_447078 [Rhizophagus irregularis]|nr:hypothetical protein RhiirB3_447078 [Rhizophagus irregularis]
MMDSKAYKMNIIDEAMSFDEFNLYWKKILISGGLRAWRKKVSNRNNYTSWEIEKDDDLPTYEVLYKRDVNKIETDQCIKCKNGVEDWDHLETNELTIKEVLELSISNLEEILLGKEKYWELIRGVYNRKFNTLSKDKDEKEDEFDWNKTLQFISNRNIYTSWEIEKDDVWERSYKIKNFLKDLPTYEVLYKRDVNKIETDQCIRCKNGVEDWDHLWICEINELTIKEVLKLSISNFEESLLKEEKHEKIKFLQNINFSFLKILYEKSEVLLGKEKYWELIRGVYNRKFNTLSKDKDEKEVINELCSFCFNALKKEFWNKMCNEVNEIELSLGIKKLDKRVRKFIDRDMKCGDKSIENQRKKLKISEKYKNREQNIKLVTKNKIISRFTEGKDTKNWNLTIKLV